MKHAIITALALAISASAAIPAHPGTINYIEGQVSIDGQSLTPKSIGTVDLQPGATLRTDSGKAEILLTPGVFLRLGSNSEVRLVNAGLTDTRVAINRGKALVEASEVHKENHIQIADNKLTTDIKQHGLYKFDADGNSVAVFDGKADVREGDEKIEVKKGKEVDADDARLEPKKFDRDEAKKNDDLYQWSSVRSKYLAEASEAATNRIVVHQRSLWGNPGWYWDPFWGTYSWLPGSAFVSPFGYSYYSPWSYYRTPAIIVPRHRFYTRPAYRAPGFYRGGAIRGGMRGGRGR